MSFGIASIEGKTSIPPPADIINYYIMRNEILHEGRALSLRELDTTGMLWDIYGVLDLLADIAIQKKTIDLLSLMKVLATVANIKIAKTAIKEEMDRIRGIQTEYSTSQLKKELHELINQWKGYKCALGTISKILNCVQSKSLMLNQKS